MLRWESVMAPDGSNHVSTWNRRWSRSGTQRPEAEEPRYHPGDRVGRFRILGVIGSGGMGVVYRALDEDLDREVALKHPLLKRSDAETVHRRFLREARAASRLLHPNVVTIFEVFLFDDIPWMAMELIDGQSLRTRLKAEESIPVTEILEHAEGLASALDAAHRLGILHRDVKPENVLIEGEDGRARLVDFGLVQPFTSRDQGESETITRLTEQGCLVGTPGYMSPEHALGRLLDRRSDIFNLGLVLYEMSSGKHPFGGSANERWLDGLLNTPPGPIVGRGRKIPEPLETIIRKALEKNPKDRYQDAGSMAWDLRRLRHEIEAGLVKEDAGRRRALRRVGWGLGLSVLAAVVGAGTWRVRGIQDFGSAPAVWAARPLTHDPVWAADPVFSPDGSSIAYSSDRTGNSDIWLIDREGGNPLQLTSHLSDDRRPAWSPDGGWIYFTSFRSGNAAIWRIPRLGGVVEEVLEGADDPAISPDGRTLAFVRRDDSGHYRVAVAPVDDPEDFRFLTTSDDGFWFHRDPTFSPDGRTICYRSARDLWVVPLEGGQPERVTFDQDPVGPPAWSGESVLFSKYVEGVHSLWRVEPGDGPPSRLTPGLGNEFQVTVSADERTLAAATLSRRMVAWVTDLRTGESNPVRNFSMVTGEVITPRGDALVLVASHRNAASIFLQPLHEGKPEGSPRQLAVLPGSINNPVVSSDGRWIAVHRVIDGRRDIWTLPIDGGSPVRFTNDEAADVTPFFSPDGRRLAFASDRAGRFDIWWAPFEEGRRSGKPERLTFGPSNDYMPRISPDGSTLVWLATEGDAENLWIRSLAGPAEARPLTSGRRVLNVWWAPGEGALLAAGDWGGVDLGLRRVVVADGSVGIPAFPPDFGRGDTGGVIVPYTMISVSADGRYRTHVRLEMSGQLWLLESAQGDKREEERDG